MAEVADTRQAMQAQADAAPHAISAYRDYLHFQESLDDAAARIARWRGLRVQWYVLTVFGVVLIVLTAIKVVELNVLPRGESLINGWLLLAAWAVALAWTWFYNLEVDRLGRRILDRRLCLRCGLALRDVDTDAHGSGVCPRCCHVFHIGEYTPPTDCIEAMRRARQRTLLLRRPPVVYPTAARLRRAILVPPQVTDPRTGPLIGFYEDRRHFERVMNDAVRRMMLDRFSGSGIVCGVIGAALPLFAAVLAWYAGGAAWWWIPLALLVTLWIIGLTAACLAGTARRAILNDQLCLSCGYPVRGSPVNEYGCGRCPECGRAFHAREFAPPGTEVVNPLWRETRRQLFRSLPADAPVTVAPAPPPSAGAPQPGGRTARRPCPRCGYDLRGTPIGPDGFGTCSECGGRFHRDPAT